MELWIRSQKGGCLIKANDVRICQLDKDNFKALTEEEAKEGWCILVNDDPCVGTYKTKERALEVLDEIQRRIIDISCFVYRTDSYCLRNSDFVYKMPEE